MSLVQSTSTFFFSFFLPFLSVFSPPFHFVMCLFCPLFRDSLLHVRAPSAWAFQTRTHVAVRRSMQAMLSLSCCQHNRMSFCRSSPFGDVFFLSLLILTDILASSPPRTFDNAAYPAVNCISSSSVNACLEAAKVRFRLVL